jgi:ribose/xylose/arabinose/galactoside ABC-type transport system permease subunit
MKKTNFRHYLNIFLDKTGILFLLIIFVVVLAILTDGVFIRFSNIINVLMQSSIVGIIALGMTFVMIISGIDLSVGGIVAICSSIGAILMANYGVSWPLAILIMLTVGLFAGMVNGIAVAKLNLAPFIVTLAMMNITRGLAQYMLGGRTVSGFPEIHKIFGHGKLSFIPVPVLIFFLLALIAYIVLNHTSFGRELFAMGGNPRASWLSGINIARNTVLTFMISGLMAGIVSLIVTSRIMCAQVTIGTGYELDAIAAAVIGGVSLFGGKGTIAGTIIGALIITTINNGLNLLGVSPFIQTAAKGLIIFGAIIIDVLRQRMTKGVKLRED